MADGIIGALRVTLSADTAAFSTGMSRARKEATASSASINKSLSSVKSNFASLAGSVAAGLTLKSLVDLGKRSLEYAGSLAEVAQQLGVTAQQLQVFRFAGSQVGISTEQMDKALSKLNITLGNARNGADAPKKAFAELSKLIGTDIVASAKNAGEAIPMVSDGLAKITDRSKRASVEVALFGRAGSQLDTLLAGGSRAINAFAAEAQKLGIILSDEQIQNADATADKLSALKQVLEARIAGTVADNAQSILSLANALTNVALATVKFLASNPQKAAALLGAMGGYAVGGPLGAAAGALASAGYASRNTKAGLQTHLGALMKNRRSYYLQNGGTPEELASGNLNPAVIAKMVRKGGLQDYNQQIRDTRQSLSVLTGTGTIAVAEDTTGGSDIGQFLAPNGPKGKTSGQLAAEAERKRKETLTTAYNLDKQELDGKKELLQAQADLTNDFNDRQGISRDIIDIEHDQRSHEIDYNLAMIEADRTIEADQKKQAEFSAKRDHELNDQLTKLRKQSNFLDEALQREEYYNQVEDAVAEGRNSRLQLEANLAETAAERRRVELQILDLAYQEKKERLQRLLDARNPNDPDKYLYSDDQRNLARIELANLNANYGLDKKNTLQSTRGPLESFLNDLPTSAAKANEALEKIAAEGLQSLTDGLTDAIMGAKSLGDVFKNVASQIIADLIRIQVQKSIVGPLGGVLSGLFGGGTFAGGGIDASLPNVVGMAGGGAFTVAGRGGTDRNLLSVNGIPVARVSIGERVSVSNDNGPGRRAGVYFDLRGAVMTEDLLRQMNAIGDGAAVRGAMGGSALAQQQAARAARRRLT